MSKINYIFKGLTVLSRSWAYAKMCEKTGMTGAELDLFIDAYKAVSKQTGQKINIFFKECIKSKKRIKADTAIKYKEIKFTKPSIEKSEIKKSLFQDKSLQPYRTNL